MTKKHSLYGGMNQYFISDYKNLEDFWKKHGEEIKESLSARNRIFVVGYPYTGKTYFINEYLKEDYLSVHKYFSDHIKNYTSDEKKLIDEFLERLKKKEVDDKILILEFRKRWWDYFNKHKVSKKDKEKIHHGIRDTLISLTLSRNKDLEDEERVVIFIDPPKEHIKYILDKYQNLSEDYKKKLLELSHLKFDGEKIHFPGLLEHHINKLKEMSIEELEKKHKEENKAVEEIWGFFKENIQKEWYKSFTLDTIPLFAWILSGIFPPLSLFVAMAMFPFLQVENFRNNINSLFESDGLKDIREKYEELSDVKRDILCEKIDETYNLFPGSTKLLMEKINIKEVQDKLNDVIKRVDEVDNKINKLNEIIGELFFQRIEDVLDLKNERHKAEPMLFRAGGPIWVDFEEGYVVRRKEVDEILNKMKENNLIFLIGKPASGKSAILRHVGYTLAKRDDEYNIVYYLDIKRMNRYNAKGLWEYLQFISDDIYGDKEKNNIGIDNIVLFIDNAHLNINFMNELLATYPENASKKIKVVIASRIIPTDIIDFYDKQYKEGGKRTPFLSVFRGEPEISNFVKIEIKNDEDLVGKIIDLYVRKNKLKRSDKLSEKLPKEYINDLWLLGYWLKAIKSKDITEYLNDEIERIKQGIFPHEGEAINMEAQEIKICPLFAILSVIGRFEVPVARDFIKDLVGELNYDTILKLNIVDVLRNGKMYGMYHSSIAKIYWEEYFEKIIEGEREDVVCKKNDLEIFVNRLRKKLRELIEIKIDNSQIAEKIAFYDKNASLDLKIITLYLHWLYIYENGQFLDVLARLLWETHHLKIHHLYPDFKLFQSEEEKDTLLPLFANALKNANDARDVGWLLGELSRIEKEFAKNVISSVGVDGFKELIMNESNARNVGELLFDLSEIDKGFAKNVIDGVGVDRFKELIMNESNAGNVGLLLLRLSWIDEGFARDVVISVVRTDANKFKMLIKQSSPEDIALLLAGLGLTHLEYAIQIWKEMKEEMPEERLKEIWKELKEMKDWLLRNFDIDISDVLDALSKA